MLTYGRKKRSMATVLGDRYVRPWNRYTHSELVHLTKPYTKNTKFNPYINDIDNPTGKLIARDED